MSLLVIAWSLIGCMFLLLEGFLLWIAIEGRSVVLWLLLIVMSIPAIPVIAFGIGHPLKCLKHLNLRTSSLETKVRLFRRSPWVSLDDVTGVGLVLTTIGRTTDWWLCYGDAQGEIRIIDPMQMGQRLREHDDIAASPLGRFATAVEDQARQIQGPDGQVATNNPFDRLLHKTPGSRTLRPREVWTPRGGYRHIMQ
jgi:hypothetical protein